MSSRATSRVRPWRRRSGWSSVSAPSTESGPRADDRRLPEFRRDRASRPLALVVRVTPTAALGLVDVDAFAVQNSFETNYDVDSGRVTWTPDNTQIGIHGVSVRVSDGNGGIDTQSYQIQVDGGASNVAPSIDSTPVTTATEQQAYSYDVNASDVDGDSLTYSLDIAPSGMSINASSGLISWTPSTGQAGSHGVTARVDDGNGGSDTQTMVVSTRAVASTQAALRACPGLRV